MNKISDTILIIDFGSQYTQLIARRVRECGVFSIVKPNSVTINEIQNIKPNGIILTGGPESITGNKKLKITKSIFNLNIPILGICYGMQLIADYFHGKVSTSRKKEFGHSVFQYKGSSKLFSSHKFKNNFNVWMSHSDNVVQLPKGFQCIGSSTNSKISAFSQEKNKIYGLQFHPEVTHTEQGMIIIKNFVIKICQCSKSWTTKNIIQDTISSIKTTVKKDNVLLALSGGVDSTVVAALLHKAIGKKLKCMFINTGLLRKNEINEVELNIIKKLKINLITINAEKIFLNKLKKIIDPEKKER